MAKAYDSIRIVTITAILVLLVLVILAGISLNQVRTLSLPISNATAILALLLPILTGLTGLTGLTLQNPSALSLSRRLYPKTPSRPWLPTTITLLLTIYSTVIVTLSMTHMVPPSALTCHLEQRWRQLYTSKNGAGIKRIQDAHECCGLHSVKDMSWPFPVKGRGAEACAGMFGRGRSCFGAWRRDEQVAAGLLLIVGVGTILVKLLFLLFIRAHAPGTQHYQYQSSDAHESLPTDGHQGRIEAQYHDDESSTEDVNTGSESHGRAITAGNGHPEGPAVQPSELHREEGRERNEWA